MKLFDRFWELNIKSNPSQTDFEYTIKQDDFGNSLRINFDITASFGIQNYYGTINIYNLNPDKRRNLVYNQLLQEFGKGPKINLVAGYKEKSGIILDGVIQRGITIREPQTGDWITKLKCGLSFKNDYTIYISSKKVTNDNLLTYLNIWIDKIFPQGDGVDDTGRFKTKRAPLFSENLSGVVDSYNSKVTLNTAIGYTGPASEVIAEIEKKFGLQFYYDSEGLNVSRTEILGGNPELEISETTGMLGSPQYTDTGAKVRTYLKPDLRLLQKIRVNSDVLDKNISVTSLNHTGDTHTNDWFSEIDASNIGQILTEDGPPARD